ncbi:radical SAM protein [Halobiforma nitratireducens]|uniref:Radical SAM domain-containing protein n=1 Tax=Halobiforma nitratireducens JCM 10879 TaxID=1227454 RepID=M0L4H5_9EURY|nr:radical SAM protein [Halobiforma nitratireducens]EMA28477.1 radical SAM domain-containing protein [Halobiforma nitratireducens JCM 10879]
MREPNHITLEVTNRCHLECSHCYLETNRGLDELSVAEIETNLLPHLREYDIESFVITGGEALLRPDTDEICEIVSRHVDELRLLTSLSTPEAASRVNDLPIDALSVSVDGPRQTHDAIRGNGTFDRVLENLRRIDRTCLNELYLNCVVSSYNEDRFSDLLEVVEPFADKVGFQLQTWGRPSDVARSAERLGCDEGVMMLPVLPEHPANTAAVNEGLRDVRERAEQSPATVQVFPPGASESTVDEWFDGGERDHRRGCEAIYRRPLIGPEGDVYPCPFVRQPMGNVRDDRLTDIWTGREMSQFREQLSKEGLLPVCNRCACSS